MWGKLGAAAALAVLTLASAPFAFAQEGVVGDSVCYEGIGCAPTTACVPGVYCQATTCDPATDCRGGATIEDSCRVNVTIDGQTCARRVTFDAEGGGRDVPLPGSYVIPGRPVPGGSVGTPGASIDGSADLTNGFVHGHNLPNDWISHAARLHVVVAGIDLGETSIGIYQSSIDTSDGSGSQVFTHGVVSARHEGPTTRAGGSVGLVLLDGTPEDCFVRAGPSNDAEVTCAQLGLVTP